MTSTRGKVSPQTRLREAVDDQLREPATYAPTRLPGGGRRGRPAPSARRIKH